jgi:hypothetical protein
MLQAGLYTHNRVAADCGQMTRKPEVNPSHKARWDILACQVLVCPAGSNGRGVLLDRIK